jgi:Uncharacterised ArCR, COG2043
MDTQFRRRFSGLWSEYFPGADLPIIWYYTDDERHRDTAQPSGAQCVIFELAKARSGQSLYFSADTTGCSGGKRYLGFSQKLRPGFEYFLSCGIPGEMEGERYKKSPELVREHLKHQPPFRAPGRYIVFKRWDRLTEQDDIPSVVVFFAPPDVLAGLFTLVNFDEPEPDGVIAPFGAGCASIVGYPHSELQAQRPRAVLGMFDVSARPCVPADVLTLAIPWPKFVRMVEDADESFLISRSWARVRSRIGQ